MDNTSVPKALRRVLIVFGALLIASLLVSGFSAVYVTLAAPQRSTYMPTTIGFEGQLADSEGSPVADGDYTITFRLYGAPTEGTPFWTEEQESVSVKDGLYSVQLGAVTAFNANAFNGARWLAVQVEEDAEMVPRIPVSAVPFALNAQQAQGLQGNPVAETVPQTDEALMWDGSAWAPQGMTLPDLAPEGSNATPNDLLQTYRSGALLTWTDADTITVSAGELMIDGYIRRNDEPEDIGFEPDAGGNGPNLGFGGSEQSGTTYDVYAVADDTESTFDLIITEGGSDPAGVSHYRKLGSFQTEPDSTDIAEGSAANFIETPPHIPTARVYSSTNVSLPTSTWVMIPLNSERWDNDGMHSTATNNTRLTARTAGTYLIIGQVALSNSAPGFNVGIKLNGETWLAIVADGSTGGAFLEASTIYQLQVDDYVELGAYQAGSSRSAWSTSQTSPEFMMVKVAD